MTIRGNAAKSGGDSPPATAIPRDTASPMVRVWDPLIRIFHWGLVGLFAVAFITGDEITWLHLTAGYTIVALLVARLVWGFVGPTHARFGDFVRPLPQVLAYLRDAARLRAGRHLGHNPAGGAMVLAMLGLLVGIAATGFMMTTDAFWGAQWVEDLHETLADIMLALIAFHVAGVLFASFQHRENLIRAMFTGRKRAE